MRADALFDPERHCGVVLIESIGFMEVFECGTGALGSPLIDELGRRARSVSVCSRMRKTRHDSILGGTKTTTKHGEDTQQNISTP